ncbi:MAG TPA: DUF6455 family protein [Candidatus Binatia bacterium]|nr:DUF6455 family protein [Candidatus Binatia bacterium]
MADFAKFKRCAMNIMQAVAERWSKYRQRRARINELRDLDCGDMRRLVQDTGLSFAELVDLAKTEGDAAELFYRQMSEIGLDPKKIDGDIMRDMQRCCSLCDNKALCTHELEDKPKRASWPSYCPNKDTLEALGRIWRPNSVQ